MTRNNKILIENKKQIELVQELKDEYKTLSYEEFMEDYQNDNLNYDDLSNVDIGTSKVYGPMYRGGSSNHFSISYKFNHGGDNEKLFFERFGVYTTELKISGNLRELKKELWKLEDEEIKVFELVRGNYIRDRNKEKKIKDDLREDIGRFERMIENGELGPNEGCGSAREYSQIA